MTKTIDLGNGNSVSTTDPTKCLVCEERAPDEKASKETGMPVCSRCATDCSNCKDPKCHP